MAPPEWSHGAPGVPPGLDFGPPGDLRGSIFDPPGADLADKTSYIFHETSYTCKDYDAESAAFREAVSLASRPFESTGPEAKKARKGKNRNPANKAIQTIAGPEAPG